MTPNWVSDAVQAFGRQMGLTSFGLAANGTAGLRFENALTLRFEYTAEALMVSVGFPMATEHEALAQLLQLAHPAVASHPRVRTAYLAKTGEALLTVRLAEREVTVMALENVFRRLWTAAITERRVVS